jgi:hypothetical protein
MGQRHQIYVVEKTKDGYKAVTAHHHQWCYGLNAASNAVELANAIVKAKTAIRPNDWSKFSCDDERHLDVVVKSVYGIDKQTGFVSMVHNENEYLIVDGQIRPDLGDNNDGAALIVIDNDKQQVRVCMFTPGHVEGEHGDDCKAFKAYTPKEYFSFYYKDQKATEMLNSNPERALLLNSEVNSVSAVEFNKIMAKSKAAVKEGN